MTGEWSDRGPGTGVTGYGDSIKERLLRERILFLEGEVRDEMANEIVRYALKHARVMMHQPLGGLGGVQSLVQKQAEQMLLIKAQMAELIAHHTGQPVERIVEDSEWEKWFSAEEAKEYGIVDHVVTSAQDVSGGGGTA